jgi:uncharacterized protein YqhQ
VADRALDGIVRLTIFFTYISLVGRYKHVRRTFEYHGAEHKVINTLESGEPLTVANALAQTRLHPRCGTSFVVIVMVVATLVFAVFASRRCTHSCCRSYRKTSSPWSES